MNAVSTYAPLTLRPYQETCIERVLEVYQRQPQGGKALIILPTGTGKTICFGAIIHLIRERKPDINVLVVAHRQELLQQAADKYRLIDPSATIGQVGAGRHEYGAPITVASVQTISRPEHLKALQRFDYRLVIIDECHHSSAAGYQSVLDTLPNAFVLGVTATPDRLDKQNIETVFGEPVYSASIIDMVEQGYLCDLRAVAIRTTTSLDGLHTQAGDFKPDELEEVIDTPVRNRRIVEAYLEHGKGRQALCFAITVKHAFHLTETFIKAGVKAAVVSGESAPEERKRILHEYERGQLEVVANCGVLLEGYDSPQTSCIIMARPTQSRALFVQALGRGTRLAPGKRDCVILDITDNCLKHRLQPQSLSRVLEKPLLDGEGVTEAKQRELREREQQERTTKEGKRAQDLVINVLARMDWRRQRSGGYVLEVGEQKHLISLVPSEETDGYYSVWAKLAPDFARQQWLKDAPLEWAQQHAERQARILLADAKNTILVDRNAAWRCKPVDLLSNQARWLRRFGIPITEDMTRGEASDLLERAFAERERKKAEKQARKQTKGARASA